MESGMSKEEAMRNFEKPVKMSIFGWKNGGGQQDTTMTPIDSVRYYFCMLNCGFMAMDHRNGYIRAWVAVPISSSSNSTTSRANAR